MLKYLAAYALATSPAVGPPSEFNEAVTKERTLAILRAALPPGAAVDEAEFDSVWPSLASQPTADIHIAHGQPALRTAQGLPPPPPPDVKYCYIGGTKHVWTIDCDQEGGTHDDCCCGGDEDGMNSLFD